MQLGQGWQPVTTRRPLIQAVHGAKLKRGSFYRNKYNRLKFKLGSANKAKVEIANRLACAIYKVLGGSTFRDIGYGRAVDFEDKIRTLINQLKALGVDIHHEGYQKIVGDRCSQSSKTSEILRIA